MKRIKTQCLFFLHYIATYCTNIFIDTDISMTTKLSRAYCYRIGYDSKIFNIQVLKYYSLTRIWERYIDHLFIDNMWWYIYNNNISLWQESEWLNLLHRQARNRFLLTIFELLYLIHSFLGQQFRTFQPMGLLLVFRTKNIRIFILSFRESESFRLVQHYHKQYNVCARNYQIYKKRIKITVRKFITQFRDATVNKRICFLSFRFNKNDKNALILALAQLHLSIQDEPKVVIFIAR